MKVTINGEVYDYDGTKAPMSEALAVEGVYEKRYAEWQSDLQAGSAKAMCVLAWLIMRREGADVPFGDIIDGTFDFDLVEMLESMNETAPDAPAGPPDPPVAPAPAGTRSTRRGTKPSSPST